MKKFILSIIMVALWGGGAWAYSFSATSSNGQILCYNITSSSSPYTVEVTSQNPSYPYYTSKPTGNIVIPSSVTYNSKTYSVTGIGYYAFWNCSDITAITIPSSVEYVVNNAFSGCSGLTTISYNATNCTDMGNSSGAPFNGCTSVTTLSIGANVTSIPSYAFKGCTGLRTVNFDATNCTSFGTQNGISNNTSITTIYIGSGVTNIPSSAFSGCSGLTAVYYRGNIRQWCEITFNSQPLNYAHSLYINNSLVTNLVIPNTITEIKANAFNGASCLTSITIPESVTSIGNSAFWGCSGLSEITIPSSVTNIGANAFYNCRGLGNVTIPNSVNSIGSNAFYFVTNIIYYGTATGSPWGALSVNGYYEDGLFYTSMAKDTLVSAIRTITSANIPNSVIDIRPNALCDCDDMVLLTIGSSVENIGVSAFKNCTGLTIVNFNATNCTSMGNIDLGTDNTVFSGCTSLSTLNIGNNVTNIPDYSFCRCRALTSISIPNSVISIGENAFDGCSGLTGDLTIPNYVTSIGASAFSGCSGLTSVTIGNSVTSIGNYAFNCSGLTMVNYTGTIAQWCEIVFGNSYANPLYPGHNLYINNSLVTNLVISEPVTEIKEYSFNGARGLRTVTIGNSVTSIGFDAFMECSGLTSVSIGNSVEVIGQEAFRLCSGLASVNLGNSVATIDQNAFEGCSGLTTVTIPESVTSIGREAFKGCSSLVEITIPFVGSSAYATTPANSTLFGYIFGLSSNETTTTQQYYSEDNYVRCLIPNTLRRVTITGGKLLYGAFYGCSMLTSVTIGNAIDSIGEKAFYGCSGLPSVTIPESVTDIGEWAFSGCNGLTSVIIPGSITSINHSVFRECTGLVSVTIPNSVTSIGGSAFYHCNALTELTIPNSVESIGGSAFRGCPNLASVTIGNSVTNIGIFAFQNCSESATVNFNATNCTSVGYLAFNKMAILKIADNVTNIPDSAFYYCYWMDSIYSYAWNPPATTSKSFNYSNTNVSSVPVIVPCGRYSTYRSATNWRSLNIRNTSIIVYSIAVYSSDENMGSVSVTQQPSCNNMTAVIVATANPGFHFAGWNDGNTENPRTVNLTSDEEFTAIFEELPTYTITVSTINPIMGTVSGSGVYFLDEETVLSVTANAGYRFTAWNDGNTDNPRTIIVTQDSTFTANFIALHNITVLSADEEMGTATGTGVYDENSEIQISATPAEHYHFVQWADGNTDNPRTITVTEDATFTAEFAIDQHTITVESVNAEMGIVSESGTYDYGTEIQISAMANDGFRFIAWNDGDTYNPRTITVTQDSTFTANFIALHTITVLSADEEMGTATGTGVYDENSEIQISATPADHYHFVQWTDGNTDNPRTITVVEDSTFTAEFAIDRFTVTVESADSTMGTVSESGTYDYGAEIEISASASEHYHFVQWNDGNTDNPRTITVVENTTFTAEFAIDQHTITIESANTEMGTVSESGTYDYGTEIEISASARDGYQFASWNDDNTDNPRTITVTSDATYIASFIPAVGIDESIATEIAIFPNPANDILNITSSETISEIEIVNVMGQVVKRIEVNSDNAACNVEDLKAGVYVVRIRTASATLSQRRFVKE
jgi:hypothetical protein